jgi:hypothetical protein
MRKKILDIDRSEISNSVGKNQEEDTPNTPFQKLN